VIPIGTTIPAQGYLLVWADNETRQNTGPGSLHAGFKLDQSGDNIVLLTPDGTVVDSVSFASQTSDISEGRFPDGSGKLRRLKKLLANSKARLAWAAAVASGVLWAASFPKIGLAGLAWIAPGLMLFSALGRDGGEAFRLGYVAGLVHYLISLYWLLFIPFPVGAVAGWLSLSAYLALYPAVWVWLCWKLFLKTFSHAASDANVSSASRSKTKAGLRPNYPSSDAAIGFAQSEARSARASRGAETRARRRGLSRQTVHCARLE
jgi:hypothetical protein